MMCSFCATILLFWYRQLMPLWLVLLLPTLPKLSSECSQPAGKGCSGERTDSLREPGCYSHLLSFTGESSQANQDCGRFINITIYQFSVVWEIIIEIQRNTVRCVSPASSGWRCYLACFELQCFYLHTFKM